MLLDHIPHNDASSPHNEVESSFVTYRMSVYVPDVDCKKCSLQFLYIMTDKSNICGIPECYYNPLDSACKGSTDPAAKTCYGAPNDTPCVQEGECYSNCKCNCIYVYIYIVYIDIIKFINLVFNLLILLDHSCTDVVITGKLPLSSFNIDGQLEDWPYKSKKMQYYGTEASTWSTDGWLQGIPLQYTIDYKTLAC